MMKHYLAIAIATIVLTGCNNKNEVTENAPLARPVELKVYGNIEANAVTRINGVTWEPNATIGISKEGETNCKYTLTEETNTINGTFKAEEGKGIKIENKTVLSAYYPYQEALTDNIYTINLARQTENIDLMTAKTYTVIENGEATAIFTFKHQLSKIELTVTNELNIANFKAENMEITINNQRTKAAYNVATNTLDIVTGSQADGEITMKGADGSAGKIVAEAILLPNDLENNAAVTTGRKIAFTIGGTTYNYNIPTNHIYKTGKIVKYDITIKSPVEIVCTAIIEDWKNDESVNGGKPIEGKTE